MKHKCFLLMSLLILCGTSRATTINFDVWPDGNSIPAPTDPPYLSITDEFAEWGIIFESTTKIMQRQDLGNFDSVPNSLSPDRTEDNITLDAHFIDPCNPNIDGTVTWVSFFQDRGAQSGGGTFIAYDLGGNEVINESFNTSGKTFHTFDDWGYVGEIHRIYIGECRDALDDLTFGEIMPVPEPPCGWIAFVSSQDGDPDIWAVRPDGTDLRQLTDLPGDQYAAQWSPDSTKIAYPSPKDAQIWVYDWLTGDNTKIYDAHDYEGQDLGVSHVGWPSWSPDGTKILFHEDVAHITVINADGTGRQVVPVESGYVAQTSWCPTGTAFVYNRRNSGASYSSDLWIYDFTDTGDIMAGNNIRLTQGASSESTTKYAPDWTPSGNILFMWGHNIAIIDPGQSPNWADPSNPNVTFLTNDGTWPSLVYGYPSWSPDLSQVVYDYWTSQSPEAHLWIMDASGDNRYQLPTPPGSIPDWGNPPSEPAEPNIHVSPLSHDFGDVEIGSAKTMLVSITNTGDADLTVTSLDFQAGSSSDFSITSAPALPATIAIAATVDVEITFSPSILYFSSATLEIGSDDADESLVQVSLSGVGVWIEPPPDEQIEEILDFIDESVEDGNLAGDGPGNSADKRLNALINMIEAAGDLIRDGLYDQAHQQLEDAYKKCDGQAPPPDFVSGPAAQELADRIQQLMQIIRGAIIVTVDGISPESTLLGLIGVPWPWDDVENYLGTALAGMNLQAYNVQIVNFDWSRDPGLPPLGDTYWEVRNLRDLLREQYGTAEEEGRKFIVVAHSWGTFLSYCALSDLSQDEDTVSCDLYLTLSSPLGTYAAHPGMYPQEGVIDAFLSAWRAILDADPFGDWIGYPLTDKHLNFWAWGDVISGPLNPLLGGVTDKNVDSDSVEDGNDERNFTTTLADGQDTGWHKFTSLQTGGLMNNQSMRDTVEDAILQVLGE